MARVIVSRPVAPFAGAWVETALPAWRPTMATSPPSRGRGSKLLVRLVTRHGGGRPLRGGVGRNTLCEDGGANSSLVAPFAGAWVETLHMSHASAMTVSRPLRGGVGRNSRNSDSSAAICSVAPFAGAWVETFEIADQPLPRRGRPLRGGVGRNLVLAPLPDKLRESPPSRGRGSKPFSGR